MPNYDSNTMLGAILCVLCDEGSDRRGRVAPAANLASNLNRIGIDESLVAAGLLLIAHLA